VSGPGPNLRYGGPWFVAASALPLGGELNRPVAWAQLLAVATARPARLAALFGLLLRSPSIEVHLSNSATGAMLREHFGQCYPGGFPVARLCQAVLILADDHRDYLSGRHRRALRNNLRRAAAAGIRCEDAGGAQVATQAMWRVVLDRRAPVTATDRAGPAATRRDGHSTTIWCRPSPPVASSTSSRPRADPSAPSDSRATSSTSSTCSAMTSPTSVPAHRTFRMLGRARTEATPDGAAVCTNSWPPGVATAGRLTAPTSTAP
jgi:hypothetical protein